MGSPTQPIGTSPSPQPTPPPKPFKERLSELVGELTLEAIGSAFVIAIIAGGRFLVQYWMGHDAKFFDFIPVGWVFDAGDLALILRFLWRAIKRLND